MIRTSLEAVNLDFPEAIAYFRAKTNIPIERYDELAREEYQTAFAVAGITNAQQLQDMREAVDRYISEGRSIQDFQKDFDENVQRYGWSYHGSRGWRSRLIANQNAFAAYGAGRWEQLNDPDLIKIAPYREIRAGGSLEPNMKHAYLTGLVLRYDDPLWAQIGPPPWDYGCRHQIFAVRDPGDGRQKQKVRQIVKHRARLKIGINAAVAVATLAPLAYRKAQTAKMLSQLLGKLSPSLRSSVIRAVERSTSTLGAAIKSGIPLSSMASSKATAILRTRRTDKQREIIKRVLSRRAAIGLGATDTTRRATAARILSRTLGIVPQTVEAASTGSATPPGIALNMANVSALLQALSLGVATAGSSAAVFALLRNPAITKALALKVAAYLRAMLPEKKRPPINALPAPKIKPQTAVLPDGSQVIITPPPATYKLNNVDFNRDSFSVIKRQFPFLSAQQIRQLIRDRDFIRIRSIEDLRQIRYFGDVTLEQLRLVEQGRPIIWFSSTTNEAEIKKALQFVRGINRNAVAKLIVEDIAKNGAFLSPEDFRRRMENIKGIGKKTVDQILEQGYFLRPETLTNKILITENQLRSILHPLKLANRESVIRSIMDEIRLGGNFNDINDLQRRLDKIEGLEPPVKQRIVQALTPAAYTPVVAEDPLLPYVNRILPKLKMVNINRERVARIIAQEMLENGEFTSVEDLKARLKSRKGVGRATINALLRNPEGILPQSSAPRMTLDMRQYRVQIQSIVLNLKGVNREKIANAIIEEINRGGIFTSADDMRRRLTGIPGIGRKTLDKLTDNLIWTQINQYQQEAVKQAGFSEPDDTIGSVTLPPIYHEEVC